MTATCVALLRPRRLLGSEAATSRPHLLVFGGRIGGCLGLARLLVVKSSSCASLASSGSCPPGSWRWCFRSTSMRSCHGPPLATVRLLVSSKMATVLAEDGSRHVIVVQLISIVQLLISVHLLSSSFISPSSSMSSSLDSSSSVESSLSDLARSGFLTICLTKSRML